RPETMLGDGAVAVNHNDDRYKHLVGRRVLLPLVERELPIVADPYPDPEVGSGAVKVTAAHDPNDFEMAKRHDVPMYVIMREDGSMNEEVPPPYRNKDRFEVREMVIADLEKIGLLDRVEPHVHAVGHCSRCDTVIEPMLSRQWFVDMKAMAAEAVEAVEQKRIELLPEFQEKIFFEWLNNIQDWCISRQLWWGHRIPVWYCRACGEVIASEEDNVEACTACGSQELEPEGDVLDTWFSSGLWPFSTMGWPEATEDLATFYPTAVLVTGYDILFFWVARMAMLGIRFMKQVPFHQVLLHGLLRDEQGEKMSKTKGNGLDPLDMIAEYGADALRYTLTAGTVMGRDMVLQRSTIEGYRNFINKIWNAARFTLGHGERLGEPQALENVEPGPFDRWILARLAQASREVGDFLDQRRFNEATRVLYQFVWHELCDWYLEISKPMLVGELGAPAQAAAHATLNTVLRESLKLLHPFMPFVTEELWQKLPGSEGSIMVQPYPNGGAAGPGLAAKGTETGETGRFIEVVQAVRALRGENGVRPRSKVDLVVVTPSPGLKRLLETERVVFCTLAQAGDLTVAEQFAEREGYAHGVGNGFEVFLSLAGVIDVANERKRIGKEVERTEERIQQIAAKLGNPAFTGKAPQAVVEKSRQELSSLQAQLAKLNDGLNQLPAG
ncbi:MAG: valine--tRNA ligase, partial [bacterium]